MNKNKKASLVLVLSLAFMSMTCNVKQAKIMTNTPPILLTSKEDTIMKSKTIFALLLFIATSGGASITCTDADPPVVNEYSSFAASIIELYRREGYNPYPHHGPEGGSAWFIGHGTQITKAQYRKWKKSGITKDQARKLVYQAYQKTYDLVEYEFGNMYSRNVLLSITNLCYNVGFHKFKYSGNKHTQTYIAFKSGNLAKGISYLGMWNKFDINNDGKTEAHEVSTNLARSRKFDVYLAQGDMQQVIQLTNKSISEL